MCPLVSRTFAVFSETSEPLSQAGPHPAHSMNIGSKPPLGTQTMRGEGTVINVVPPNRLLPTSLPHPGLNINKWHRLVAQAAR